MARSFIGLIILVGVVAVLITIATNLDAQGQPTVDNFTAALQATRLPAAQPSATRTPTQAPTATTNPEVLKAAENLQIAIGEVTRSAALATSAANYATATTIAMTQAADSRAAANAAAIEKIKADTDKKLAVDTANAKAEIMRLQMTATAVYIVENQQRERTSSQAATVIWLIIITGVVIALVIFLYYVRDALSRAKKRTDRAEQAQRPAQQDEDFSHPHVQPSAPAAPAFRARTYPVYAGISTASCPVYPATLHEVARLISMEGKNYAESPMTGSGKPLVKDGNFDELGAWLVQMQLVIYDEAHRYHITSLGKRFFAEVAQSRP